MNLWQRNFLRASDVTYLKVIRPLLFRMSAQEAHHRLLLWLATADQSPLICQILTSANHQLFTKQSLPVGGVVLDYPLIVAAGLVKGHGFVSEDAAMQAVEQGQNIIPGWRSLPTLVGAVEFGSFTRYPRIGNPSTVVWRDAKTQSTQNRVGLKNPGACAAAQFLSQHKTQLPAQFGINIAVSPRVTDERQSIAEVLESIAAFVNAGIVPTWFTLNLSCPNTEDDPGGNQTELLTRNLCGAVVDYLQKQPSPVPLWVKVSPGLAEEQYHILMHVFNDIGVKAVIATNTLAQPTPDNPAVMGGVGGGKLQTEALIAVRHLMQAKHAHAYAVDVIGCGGILGGQSYGQYLALGVQVMQYWSALVYRGLLAAPLILAESKH